VEHNICPLFSCPVLVSQEAYASYFNGADAMALETVPFNYTPMLTKMF
jgi:hypothetical protein